MIRDFWFSARALLRHPGFTVVAVFTLALGFAGTIAVFSIVNSILLNPLAFPSPERLVKIYEYRRTQPKEAARTAASVPDFAAWREKSRSFDQIAAVQGNDVLFLFGEAEPYRVQTCRVTHDLFPLLGHQPVLGRGFQAADDLPGAEPVVILSHDFWQQHFGGDPTLVGRTLKLSGRERTVVGIMPKSFHFPHPKVEIWAPLTVDVAQANPWARFLDVYGRLKPGVDLRAAQAEMAGIAKQLEEDNPASNSDMTVDLAPLKEDIIGETGKPLKLLLWAVCFVLLIACVNVMNLVLVRTLSRQREFAVCSAFGASRSRTLRQFLAEGLVLALLSGGLGVLLASWVVKLFVGFGPEGIPRLEEVGVDARAIGFALIVALLVGVALGLFPALSTQGESLSEALRVGSRGTEGIRRRRARAALVVVEVGLAVVLLICVGLMTVSFVHLFRTDAGFQPQNILTLRVTLSPSVYPTPEQQASFYEQLLGRIGTLPGVEGAAMVNHLPLAGEDTDWTFTVEGRQVQRGQEPKAGYRVVEADYFRTMKIPLVYGRGFQPFDHRQGTTAVIVNQTMARLSWPAESPLGKRFRLGNVDSDQPWLTVVGVVGDVRHTGLAIPARPELFLPFSPDWWDSMALVVRTGGDPAQWVGPVRSAIRELDKNLPIDDVETMEHVLASSLRKQRFNLLLMALFSAVALTLALVGVYAVLAQSVAYETDKIAVQIALGAQRKRVLMDVLRRGMLLVTLGVFLGLVGAFGFTRLLSSLLYGVTATDPMIFLGVAILFLIVALIAVYPPASRATRVDPMACLR